MKKFAIIAAALATVGMLATPVMAADVTPYISVRLATVIDDTGSDTDFTMGLQSNSRFGARFENADDLRGGVEMSMAGPVGLRLLWGSYTFGEVGTLLVGQHYTPYHMLSDEAMYQDLGNIGYGALYDGRQPQIKFTLPMGLSIAAIAPNRTGSQLNPGTMDMDTILPKLAVSYKLALDPVTLKLSAAYNMVNEKSKVAGDDWDETITSYLMAAGVNANAGPAKIMGNLFYGQNLANFGIAGMSSASYTGVGTIASARAIRVGNDLEDSTTFGGYAQGTFDTGMAKVAAGVGYTSTDNDEFDDPDARMSYWAQATIPVAKTFFLVPGISYQDEMDDAAGEEQKDAWQAGIKWQMNL